MASDCDHPSETQQPLDFSRRALLNVRLKAAGMGFAAFASPRELRAAFTRPNVIDPTDKRFPYFKSTPVRARELGAARGILATRSEGSDVLGYSEQSAGKGERKQKMKPLDNTSRIAGY